MSTDQTSLTYSVTCTCGKRHTLERRDKGIECEGCGLRVTGFPAVSDRIEDLPDYLTAIRKNTDADGRFWPLGIGKGIEWPLQSETPPPSEGGPPFTLAEIDESIRLMERRLETGQGTRASAMCRLSLDATKALRGMVEDAQADVDRLSERLAKKTKVLRYQEQFGCTVELLEKIISRAQKAEAEVTRLLHRTWDEHQDDDHPCTCHDCRTHARNSGLWVEVTDERGRVVDFRPAVEGKDK